MQDKTLQLIEDAYQVLAEYNPMTLRQCYYQLVSKHVIDNNMSQYKRLSNALVQARQQGLIPWEWIEDRVRQPQAVSMWADLTAFMKTVRQAYRKDIWSNQPGYLEVWLEKDALSGVFRDITSTYGVTLVVGRGYNSWSAYKDAADRIACQDKPTTILYFGDFDPSGMDITRALADGLRFFGSSQEIQIERVALTKNDVITYDLPPDFTKKTDTRSKAFIAKYGDIAVELDALPLPVLQDKIRGGIRRNLDLTQLTETEKEEEKEQKRLEQLTL